MQPSIFQKTTVSDGLFHESISHPDYWLWDSWVNKSSDECIELFCLAVPRKDAHGAPIHPQHRNQHRFHIRKFFSSDKGLTWRDIGNILSPDDAHHQAYMGNVWSGSALELNDSHTLHAFTGIMAGSPDHPFLQSLWLGKSTVENHIITPYPAPLLCPKRDFDDILNEGYYLDIQDRLGHISGEKGGPILAWRDPFVFFDNMGELRCIWSAKISSTAPAIGHAKLHLKDSEYVVQHLYSPILLPDAEDFTQAEVPKIIWSEVDALYYMLLSSCNRLREGQPDSEVSKEQRLYKSSKIEGPWEPYANQGSILPMPPHRFGCSIVDADFQSKKMRLITPITEQATSNPLTIAPIIEINFK